VQKWFKIRFCKIVNQSVDYPAFSPSGSFRAFGGSCEGQNVKDAEAQASGSLSLSLSLFLSVRERTDSLVWTVAAAAANKSEENNFEALEKTKHLLKVRNKHPGMTRILYITLLSWQAEYYLCVTLCSPIWTIT
jgi:hypothetical protein